MESRDLIEKDLLIYQTNLVTEFNERFALMNGLEAFIVSEIAFTEQNREHFSTFASGLIQGVKGIRVVQVYPPEGPLYIYPIPSNEATLGRTLSDLVNDERPHVRQDVAKTIQTGEMTLSGPYELRQGGLGLVLRKAVYIGGDFWGIAVIVFDLPPLLMEAGLAAGILNIDVCIKDTEGNTFWGNAIQESADPVTLRIPLLKDTWEISAIPAEGWLSQYIKRYLYYQAGFFVIIVLISFLFFMILTRKNKLERMVREKTIQLESQQQRLKTIFRESPLGFILLDKDFSSVISANDRFWKITGLSPQSAIIKWKDLLVDDDFKNLLLLQNCLSENPLDTCSFNFKINDREQTWCHFTVSAVRSDSADFFIGIMEDITRQKNDELFRKTSLEEKDLLLREIHHRTKNSLNMIRSMLVIQAASLQAPEVHQLVDEMDKRIMTLAAIHQKLHQSTTIKEIDIAEMFQDIGDLVLESFTGKTSIKFQTDIESVLLDVETVISLCIVLNELLTNSLKYAFADKGKGLIELQAHINGGELHIKYSDDGVGLPENFSIKEMKSFGLASVRAIVVSQLNGEIDISGDKGFRCRIILPINEQSGN